MGIPAGPITAVPTAGAEKDEVKMAHVKAEFEFITSSFLEGKPNAGIAMVYIDEGAVLAGVNGKLKDAQLLEAIDQLMKLAMDRCHPDAVREFLRNRKAFKKAKAPESRPANDELEGLIDLLAELVRR